jgi:hypothetical protein
MTFTQTRPALPKSTEDPTPPTQKPDIESYDESIKFSSTQSTELKAIALHQTVGWDGRDGHAARMEKI